ALPIELLTFRAEKQGEGVVLTWQTASELNNDRFVIERAGLDLNFELIGQINGAGTTLEEQQYTFTDRHPLSGQNYYRLRQIDFDGNSSFSPYAFVEFASEYDEVSFYPNPMSESGLTIELSAREAGRLEVQIFNLAGLMLANYSYEIDEGYNKLNINARDLHPGMYQLILTVDGSRQISKLVVH
ncbi:MAG: T9SS C-terminal target domain-containing protein, partial [Bacteroidetes bacterium]